MAMGLTNAAPTSQQLMDSIFQDLDFVSCYLDDIMIASKSVEESLQHIETVLQRLEQHNLLARESKCAFFLSEVKFLGYVFSTHIWNPNNIIYGICMVYAIHIPCILHIQGLGFFLFHKFRCLFHNAFVP